MAFEFFNKKKEEKPLAYKVGQVGKAKDVNLMKDKSGYFIEQPKGMFGGKEQVPIKTEEQIFKEEAKKGVKANETNQ